MNRARQADSDILRPINPVSGLCVRLGGAHLIHLFVVALFKIDDRSIAGSANEDHRKTVRRRVGKRY